MKEFALTGDVITGAGEKSLVGIHHVTKSGGIPFWRRFLNEVKANFNAPFVSNWEQETGLHWRDWGKL